MKLFKNKKTGEMYLCKEYDPRKILLQSLYDEKIVWLSGREIGDFEEINVAPEEKEPAILRYQYVKTEEMIFDDVQAALNGDGDIRDGFSIHNTFHIPVKGYEHPIPFNIVHVDSSTRSIYLMPKDILAMLPMAETASWLKEFENKLPWDLRKVLKPMEHINSSGAHTGLIMLPSIKNMGVDEKSCTGKDDITFDAFKDEASRCKNFKGETQWYWTDTPNANSSSRFWLVYSTGGRGCDYAISSGGVCPLLKLSGDELEDEDDWTI